MNSQKGLAPIVLLIGILIIASGAFYYFQNNSHNEPEVKITLPSTTQSQPSTADNLQSNDMKVYTNNKYHYQLQFPSEWKERENVTDDGLVLLSPKNEVVFVGYNANPQKLSLEQNHKQNWPDKTYQNLNISGKKAIKSELGFYNIQLEDGGYINISYDGCYGMSCEASPSHKEKFEKIISSFTFL